LANGAQKSAPSKGVGEKCSIRPARHTTCRLQQSRLDLSKLAGQHERAAAWL
jgi:hypothetical protein